MALISPETFVKSVYRTNYTLPSNVSKVLHRACTLRSQRKTRGWNSEDPSATYTEYFTAGLEHFKQELLSVGKPRLSDEQFVAPVPANLSIPDGFPNSQVSMPPLPTTSTVPTAQKRQRPFEVAEPLLNKRQKLYDLSDRLTNTDAEDLSQRSPPSLSDGDHPAPPAPHSPSPLLVFPGRPEPNSPEPVTANEACSSTPAATPAPALSFQYRQSIPEAPHRWRMITLGGRGTFFGPGPVGRGSGRGGGIDTGRAGAPRHSFASSEPTRWGMINAKGSRGTYFGPINRTSGRVGRGGGRGGRD
ncbi:hypothetical protein H0H81_006410 [Sphagnurus paluster]|uniref:Uncharacterized protein n=1 Tax=Sphagnurus paluster TaxID=117069 RepID=A0A9P7K8U4_9AGAR|nr:hypothetical protein H0H81_006410 [Sphagnurus paluster]